MRRQRGIKFCFRWRPGAPVATFSCSVAAGNCGFCPTRGDAGAGFRRDRGSAPLIRKDPDRRENRIIHSAEGSFYRNLLRPAEDGVLLQEIQRPGKRFAFWRGDNKD